MPIRIRSGRHRIHTCHPLMTRRHTRRTARTLSIFSPPPLYIAASPPQRSSVISSLSLSLSLSLCSRCFVSLVLPVLFPSPTGAFQGTMAEYQDEFIRTDEYGNPIPEQYGATAEYSSGYRGTTTEPPVQKQQQQPEKLHRSGSSSSSSEDDGQGGRRKKKGLKGKIKEKLPGTHKHTVEEKGFSGEQGGEHQEKKGTLEKIKEKLPGHHH